MSVDLKAIIVTMAEDSGDSSQPSGEMVRLFVPDEKVEEIEKLLSELVEKKDEATFRKLARVAGKVVATRLAIPPARMFTWELFKCIRVGDEDDWDDAAEVTEAAVEEVLEPHLASNEYLVGGSFSCADVVVGWSLNWGRRLGMLGEEVAVPATRAYLARLLARPHCVLNKD